MDSKSENCERKAELGLGGLYIDTTRMCCWALVVKARYSNVTKSQKLRSEQLDRLDSIAAIPTPFFSCLAEKKKVVWW